MVLPSPDNSTARRLRSEPPAMRPPAAAWTRFAGMVESKRQALRLEVHLLDSKLVAEPCTRKKLRCTMRPHGTHHRHFGAVRSLIFLDLRRQRFGQSKLSPRDYINAHRIAQSGDFQFQGRVQRYRLGLSAFDVLELKTQVNAAEVLVNVQHEKRCDHATQRDRPVQPAHLHRLNMPHDPRIVDALDSMKLRHCPRLLLARHAYTLSAHRSFALRERGLPIISCSLGWITCFVSTRSVPARSPSWNACFTRRSSRE